MPKAISMVTFIDRDDNDKVYQLKVTVNNDFSVQSEYVGKALPQLTELPKKSLSQLWEIKLKVLSTD